MHSDAIAGMRASLPFTPAEFFIVRAPFAYFALYALPQCFEEFTEDAFHLLHEKIGDVSL